MGKLTENLPVRLTDAELASKAFELGRAVMEVLQRKEDLKEYVSDEKQKIDEAQAQINEFAKVLEQRQEMRAVDCFEQYDHERAIVSVIRTDTHEIVRERQMTEEDRQLTLYSQPIAVNENDDPFFGSEPQIESVETDRPGDLIEQVIEDIPPAPEYSSDGVKVNDAAYIEEIERAPKRKGKMRDQCAAMVQPKGSKQPPAQCLQSALLGSVYCEWHNNKRKKMEVNTKMVDTKPEDDKTRREERKEDRDARREERKDEREPIAPHPENPIVEPEEPEVDPVPPDPSQLPAKE